MQKNLLMRLMERPTQRQTDRPTILQPVSQRLVHHLNMITCGLSRHSCSQKITHNGSYLCDKSSASVLNQTSHHLVTVGLSNTQQYH